MIGSMMDDNSVIDRILNGESESFRILVERHRKVLLNYIWRMIRQSDDVEEIGQEVFLQAYRNLGGFDPTRGVPFSAWLIRIARNHCLNHLKKQQRASDYRASVDAEAATGPNEPADALQRKQLADSMQTALATLSPEFREAFVLVAINGIPVTTAATVQGVAVGTIKSRLARARQALNKALEAHHAA